MGKSTPSWITVDPDRPETYPPFGAVCTFVLDKSTPCWIFDGVRRKSGIYDDRHRRRFLIGEIVCWKRKAMTPDSVDRRNEFLLRRGW